MVANYRTMDLIRNLPTFILTAFFLALIPGQTVAMILRQALIGGTRTAFTTLLGTSSALITWGLLSAIGLSQVFTQSQTAYDLLKYCGVAYLLFLSMQTFWHSRRHFGSFDIAGKAEVGIGPAFRLGYLTNMTNVKAAVFAVAFIPTFVPADFNLFSGVILLSFIQALTSASWYSILISLLHQASGLLTRPRNRRVLTVISGLGILVLAGSLLLAPPR